MTVPPASTQVWGAAAVPATCGELVQGTLDGIPCLVSCPIDHFSTARVRLDSTPGWKFPSISPKAAFALEKGLAHFQCEQMGGELDLKSDIPRGRGYGSSTADIGAALFALAQALGQSLPAIEAARLAVSIEPSDSTLFPGLALFNHREGTLFESWGSAPPLDLLLLDPGGEVDTVAFNQQDHAETLKRMAHQHHHAFRMLRQGLLDQDREAIGESASLSANLHQTILFNPLLDLVRSLASQTGALGICRAHSGTILGMLLHPQRTDLPDVKAYIQSKMPSNISITAHQLTDGGTRVPEYPYRTP